MLKDPIMKRIFVFLLTAASWTSCGSNFGQQQTYNCCPRNAMQFYTCPDQDSFAKCWNDADPGDCTADPSRNLGCPALWPNGPLNQHK